MTHLHQVMLACVLVVCCHHIARADSSTQTAVTDGTIAMSLTVCTSARQKKLGIEAACKSEKNFLTHILYLAPAKPANKTLHTLFALALQSMLLSAASALTAQQHWQPAADSFMLHFLLVLCIKCANMSN